MVKLYESAYTYLPFIYLYVASTVVAVFYHSLDPFYVHYRPYTVLILILVNTSVFRYYKNGNIVRSILHKQTWKCCTYATNGIIANLVHEMVFTDHHFNHYHHNAGWSSIYLGLVLIFGYKMKSITALTLVNIAFLLVPIKRVWQINLHVYTIFVSISIYMLYSKCRAETLIDNTVVLLPLLRYFPYLRVQDELIWVGIIQLYVEYYQRYIPENDRIGEEIDKSLKELDESIQSYEIPDDGDDKEDKHKTIEVNLSAN